MLISHESVAIFSQGVQGKNNEEKTKQAVVSLLRR